MRSIFRNMFVRVCMLVLLAAFVVMFVSLHLKPISSRRPNGSTRRSAR